MWNLSERPSEAYEREELVRNFKLMTEDEHKNGLDMHILIDQGLEKAPKGSKLMPWVYIT